MGTQAARRKQLLSRASLAAWAALIALGSLLQTPPGAGVVVAVKGGDHGAHILAYGVLCALAWWNVGRARPVRALLLAGAGAALFGLALECIQPFTGRAFEGVDVAANSAGVAIALLVLALAHATRRTPPQ